MFELARQFGRRVVAIGRSMKENISIAGKISQLVDDIATVSEGQSQGIARVSTAVQEMNDVTQSTASNAEESAAAAEELNGQAEQMKGYVQDLSAIVKPARA